MIMSALFSIAAFTGNIFVFNSLKREIDGRLREAMKVAALCFIVLLGLIIIGLGLSGINLKVDDDIRDEIRSGHESLQSEIRKFFLMMYGLMAACVAVVAAVIVTVVVSGIARIRKLEHRTSELEHKLDDPLLTPGKRIHRLRILSDSDSQAVRRIEESPPAYQEKGR